MEIVEAPAFTRYLHDYLNDDQYRSLQMQLVLNPEVGYVMPGTGGFRKMRWANSERGKGRRGGLRIILLLLRAGSADLAVDTLRQE
jgi:hypothetical protein